MKLRNFVALATISGVGGYCLYTYGLSDSQRTEIHERVAQVRNIAGRVHDLVKPLVDDAIKNGKREQDHTNQDRTRQQWEALGL